MCYLSFFISEFVMLLSKDSKKSSSKGKNKKLRTKKPHRSGEAKTKDITGKSTTQANANMNNLKTVRNNSRFLSSKYSFYSILGVRDQKSYFREYSQ